MSRYFYKVASAVVWVFFITAQVQAQSTLTFTDGLDAAALANVLKGSSQGVSITGTTPIKGVVKKFNLGPGSHLNMSQGVFLTTGAANDAKGPKVGPSDQGTDRGEAGDTRLQNVLGVATRDASVLEFTFVPTGKSITFRYAFASDEYDEYVCSTINDGFALLLSGAGITDPNGYNIARTSSDEPVSINTINDVSSGTYGNPANCTRTLAERTAQYDTGSGVNGDDLSFDGYTQILTATYNNLTPCTPYTLRVVIADALDGFNDSGIFLEAGTFSAPTPAITITGATDHAFCTGSTVILTAPADMGAYQWYKNGTAITTNGTSVSLNVTTPGTYKVVVTPSGCTTTLTSNDVVLTQDAKPGKTLTYSTNSLCKSNPLPIAVETTTGATYLWSNGATTPSISVTAAGDYQVTVSKGACQETSQTVHVTDNTLTSGIVATNISCNGISLPDGKITLNPGNGLPPYHANWDHIPGADDGLDDLTGLAAGSYHVVVSDANGCTKSETVTISNPTALNPLMTVVAGSSAGTASVNNVSGGTPGYTYQWIKTGGTVVSTSASATNLAAGDYTVVVTDSRGCSKTLNYTEEDGCMFALNTKTFKHVSCPGLTDGYVHVNLNETSGVTYTWLKDNVAFATTRDIDDIGKGTYQLEAVDGSGCKVFVTQVIEEPALTLTASGVAPDCHGGYNGQLSSVVSSSNGYGQTADYTYLWTNSQGATVGTEQNLTVGTPQAPIGADTYNILVYYTFPNGDQCTMNAPVTISEPGVFSYNITKENILCKGQLTGKITLSISGGTTPYYATWSSAADGYLPPVSPIASNPQVQTGLGVGDYMVTGIVDAKGCGMAAPLSATVSITEPAEELVINSLTQGSTRGTVVLNVSGGTGAITYLWSNGSTAKEPNNLQENVLYTVTATDANGCTKQASITLNTNGCHIASQLGIAIGTTCFGGNDGSVSINITAGSGSGSYTYSWTVPAGQTPPTVEDPTGLKAGDYTLTITDTEDGCQSVLNDIHVTEPGQIVNAKTIVDVACHDQSNGSISLATTGGTKSYTYLWTASSPSFSSTSKDITDLSGRTYHLKVTDAKGCIQEEDVVVVNPDALSVSFASTDAVCYGSNNATITPTPSGGWPAYTYAWTNSGSFTSSDKDITGLTPGTYNLKVTDARACTLTVSKTVGQPSAALTASESHSNVTCHGGNNGSITLTPSGGTPGTSPAYTYSWTLYGVVKSTDQNPTGLVAGTYTLLMKDSRNCEFTMDVTLTEPAAPPVSSLNQNSCEGTPSTVVLNTTTGKTSYQWYKVGSGGSLVAITDPAANATTASLSIPSDVTSAGEYVVKVNNGTCDEYSDKYKVSIDPVPTAQIDIDPNRNDFCNGQTVTLTSHNFASNFYEWKLNGTTLTGQTTRSISVTTGGTYTLVIHNRQCNSTDGQTVITYHAPFTLTTSKTDVTCPDGTNGSATTVPTGEVPAIHYVWKNASNATIGTDANNITGVAAGAYTVTATDGAGCVVTSSATVAEPAFTVVPTIVNVSCAGGSNGSISLAITTPSFGACSTIVWKNQAGTTVGSGGTSVTGLGAGTYSANFTCGSCSIVRYYTITEPSPLTNTFVSTQPLCNGQKGSITAGPAGGTSPYSYAWSSGQTTGSISNLDAGSYTLTITDSKSCTLTTAAVVITVPSAVSATISAFQNPSCNQEEDGSITVTASGGTPGYTYSWSNGKTTAKIIDIGVNTYTVTIKDANLCSTTVSKTLTAGECAEDKMVLKLEATRPSCEGRSDGIITVTLTGGVAPFTYDWSHLSGTDNGPSAGGVSSGGYQLKVYDSHSPNRHTVTETVTVPPGVGVCPVVCSLTVAPVITNATCNGTANGSISLTFENGTAPYTVDWDHIDGTDDGASLSGLKAGSYKAVVKDAVGCYYTLTPYVGQPDIVQIFASQLTVCPGRTVTLTSPVATGNLWSNSATTQSITVGAGTYSLSLPALPSCSTATASVTITERTDCSVKSSSCDPAPFPTIPLVNNCGHELLNLALVAAQHNYSAYLENVKDEFRYNYINKCLSSYEQFGMNYEDKEHHYTLYYYDQGGNLVRTVPPEGVKIISDDESLDSIRIDRANKTRTVFTKHTYPTTYSYNSLGQLTAQNMPDHRTMGLESQTNLAGASGSGIPAGLTITSTQFTEGGNGVLTAYDPGNNNKGYLFTTKDGGKTWSALSKIGTMNLRDVEVVYESGTSGPAIAYVIGDDGVFLKSVDNGANWTLVPTGIDADFIAMDFSDKLNGAAFDKNGKLYLTSNGATNWTLYTGGSSLESVVASNHATLTSISFIGEDLARATLKTATTGFISESTDHGYTWYDVNSYRTNELKVIQMLNEQWAVGLTAQGLIVSSSDKGHTWSLYPGYVPTGTITEMNFRSLTKGIVLSSGKIYFTNDNGKTWNEPSSLGTDNNNILHMEIRSDLEGYAFKADKLFRTIDGGFTWTLMTIKVQEGLAIVPLVSFEAVASLDDGNSSGNLMNKLFVAGRTAANTGNAVIYQYRANPQINEMNWMPLDMSDLPGSYTIKSMHFSNDDNHAVVLLSTGEMYKTDNYSELSTTTIPKQSKTDWSNASTYAASAKMKFIDSEYGTMVASGTIYTTTNAGDSWNTLTSSGYTGDITAADFVYDSGKFHGVLSQIGDSEGGLIAYNEDVEGSSWTETGGLSTLPPLNDISMDPSSGSGVAVGERGAVVLQVYGPAWKLEETLRDTKAQVNLLAVAYAGSTIVGVGEKGTILYNTPGYGWSVKQLSGLQTLNAVAFDASAQVYAAGNGILAKADVSNIDNITALSGVAASTNILTLEFDKGVSIAAGENGKILIPTSPTVWTCVTDEEPEALYGSDMADNSVGYAVGKQGTVLKTTDGGKTWQDINSVSDKTLRAVSFVTADIGVVVGDNGTLKRTKNGGLDKFGDQVIISPAPTGVTFTAVQMVDVNYAIAVGRTGTGDGYPVIYESTNNGKDWTIPTIENGGGAGLNDVHFPDASFGLAVGNNGTLILITINSSGHRYINVSNPTLKPVLGANDLLSIYCVDRETAYAGSTGGNLFKTINGGSTWVAESNTVATGDLLSLNFTDRTNGFLAGTNSSLGQLVDEKDLYSGKFWYDELGRLTFSQNAKQFNAVETISGTDYRAYSYTLYDDLGRITEVGELLMSKDKPMSQYTTLANAGQLKKDQRTQFLADAYLKRQVTRTYYDESKFTIPDFDQSNLRNRVASVSYSEDGTVESEYDHASHFSYDIHGNVKNLVQDYRKMATDHAALADQRYKRMVYEYDLVSGNVNKVSYQQDKPDQFFHKYQYDADNRITQVQTSNNGYTWDKDAKYSYYDHGPLARTEIGDQKVQAMDYAYTLQGWIKAVNSETLNSSRDIGKDGVSGNTNKYVGSDAFGYSLAYFNNDYTPIGGTSAQTFMASVSGNTALATDTKDLYNGNISRMVTAMTNAENDLDKRVVMPRMASYKYDQLNRIKQAKSYMDINFSTNAWGNDNNDSYKETFCYDANGNITDLTRNQKYIGTGTPLELDHMRYNYEKIGVDASYKKYTNKLTWVDELAPPTPSINDDIEDQYLDNYKYDDIGNLTYDRNEEIDLITWTVSGKVKEVKRKSTSTKYDLEFLYDATGKRIAKIKKPAATKTDATTWITTWYMHDASGNVMATYEYRNPLSADKFCLKEQMIYGSARLGICQVDLNLLTTTTLPTLSERILGNKYFEQSNHLGNVISVVSDKRIPYDAQGANLVPNPHMDNSTSGLATSWVWLGTSFQGSPSIVTGNGFTGNAQRVDMGSSSRPIIKALFSTVAGKQYKISIRYRTNCSGLRLSGNTAVSSWGQVIPVNTGNAVTVSYIVTTTGNENGFSIDLNGSGASGMWVEFDDVVLQDAEGIIDSYQASVISIGDYYAFGSPMKDRTCYSSHYRYGFNGQEREDEVSSGDYNFGFRIYDSRLGRFLSIDLLAAKYPYSSPYVYGDNNPIRFTDIQGLGPDDRVAKAKSFFGQGIKYSQAESLNQGEELRTGNSPAALAYLDCSELVYRVLAADGLTNGVQCGNTQSLINLFKEEKGWYKSQTPKVGDIYLWRDGDHGHTGIVTGINEDGTLELTSAYSTKEGVKIQSSETVSSLTTKKGWQGFFRPMKEQEGTVEQQIEESKQERDFWKQQYEKYLGQGDDEWSNFSNNEMLNAQSNINSLEQTGHPDAHPIDNPIPTNESRDSTNPMSNDEPEGDSASTE